MGGRGSGKWYRWDKKTTVEDANHIDIRYLKKENLLHPGYIHTLSWSQRGSEIGSIRFLVELASLQLFYRYRVNGGDWEDVSETVRLDCTPCHYGGSRPWFRCPQCTRRVAVLYGEGKRFLCRHCYKLPYASQHENYLDRMIRKSIKIRERLGANMNLFDPIWKKPKGMHWSTFERWKEQEKKAHRGLVQAMIALTER